jgi:hypothetical protein
VTAPAPDFTRPLTRSLILHDAIAKATANHRPPAELRLVPTLTFKEFVARVNPRFRWYGHCEQLVTILQKVADDEMQRVIIMMPPRHSKSETVSRLFSAYYLYRHPDRWVGLASYAAALAYKLSRAARDFARLGGVRIRDDAESVQEWETKEGGGLWAAGVGGPATGKGMSLGILDDPIKNAEEAASDVIGDRNQEWWSSTWYTRQEPGAALIVITTRWPGPGDLVGWLLEQEKADDHPEKWHVVSFEAIKGEKTMALPPSCSLEPDARATGEALCPERYPIEKLRKIAARIGSFFFNSLFQQLAVRREGQDVPVGLVAGRLCRASRDDDGPLLGSRRH